MSAAIEAKRRKAEAARARLGETVAVIRHKTSPKVIAQEAVDSAKERGTELAETSVMLVRENPQASAAAVVATGAFLLRKPIGRLIGRLFRRNRKHEIAKEDSIS